MTARQKLFNYFRQEHDISLLDSDFNEVVEIVKGDIIAEHEAGQIERINNYGRHQFNRGYMKLGLVKFEDWKNNVTLSGKD